jgi:acyl carrier protein
MEGFGSGLIGGAATAGEPVGCGPMKWIESPPISPWAGQRPVANCRAPDGESNVTEEEIEAKVIEIVAEQMGTDKAKVTRDTSFVEDLNADSLDQVELVMEFEDEFETSIPDEKAEQLKTVGQAIEFIKQAHGVE